MNLSRNHSRGPPSLPPAQNHTKPFRMEKTPKVIESSLSPCFPWLGCHFDQDNIKALFFHTGLYLHGGVTPSSVSKVNQRRINNGSSETQTPVLTHLSHYEFRWVTLLVMGEDHLLLPSTAVPGSVGRSNALLASSAELIDSAQFVLVVFSLFIFFLEIFWKTSKQTKPKIITKPNKKPMKQPPQTNKTHKQKQTNQEKKTNQE